MLALAAAAILQPVSYRFPATPVPYNLDLTFDGYIPVLGGNEGTVDVSAGITVKGLPADADGNPRAMTDLSSVKIVFNGATLPFGKDQVQGYFPNTVTATPQGKVLKNDAPNKDLPVQLPGLDVKRFPDLTYLAIEFPADGVEAQKPFSYSRAFGDSQVNYTITPTIVTPSEIDMNVKLTEDYENQEDDAHNLTKDPRDAAADVKTHVQGAGTVVFDVEEGMIRKVDIKSEAHSTVTDLKTKAVSKRDLKMGLTVTLKG